MRAVVMAFLVAACATTSTVVLTPSVVIRDAPEERRFYLSIRNDLQHPICLYPTNWPDKAGVIEQAAGRAWIEVAGKRFAMENLDGGYCPGCRMKLNPRQSATAFVSYANFNLPEALGSHPKGLHFQPEARSCD